MNKLKEQLKKVPKPLISSIAYMVVVFFQTGINLLTTPIFSRILTTSDYGVTSTYASWYNIFSVFITLNLHAGVYNNALIDYDNDRKKMTSSFLSISILMSIIAFGIYSIFREKILMMLGMSEYLIYYMFVNFITAPAWGFFLAKEKFDYKYLKPLIFSIICFILNPIIGIIGIRMFPENKAVAKIIFSGLPTVIINTILLVKILIDGKAFYNKKYWKYALSFNIPLIPHYLSGIVLAQSDRIMIQKIIDNSAAGIYGVAYSLSMVLQGVLTGINAAWIPFTFKNLKKEKHQKVGHYSEILLVLIGGLAIILSILAPEIIRILAPIEYFEAVWVIPPIILGLYFSFVSSLFSNVEFFYKKNVFTTIATTIAAILNIILNAIFIPKYGFVAAGYTTAIGYLILAIAHYIFMKKIIAAKVYNIRNIVIISFFITSFIGVSMFLYNYTIIRYAVVLIICISTIVNFKKIVGYLKRYINDVGSENQYEKN